MLQELLDKITRNDILSAIKEIDKDGIRTGRHSSTYDLEYEGKYYPPKYILSLASKYANGRELEPAEFEGGEKTDAFKILRNLGFDVKPKKAISDGYTWVPVYRMISEKLFEYENNQAALIQIIKNAGITEGIKDKTLNGEKELSEIDPFTFFSYIHKVKNIEKRKEVVYKILEQLEIAAEINDFDGIPTSNAFQVWYFGYEIHRKKEDIPAMWELFKQARDGDIQEATYIRALQVITVRDAKLTTGLFIANPEQYLPINGQTIPFLEVNGINTGYSSLTGYLQLLKKAKEKLNQPFYVISHRAYLENTKKPFWRIGTTDGEKSYWEEMLRDSEIKIGWPEIGDLRSIPKIRRDDIYNRLIDEGYTYKGHNPTVSKKAGEMWSFFKIMNKGDYVVAQNGYDILGIGVIEGDYFFDEEDEFPQKRKVRWVTTSKDFPKQKEGNLTTVHEIKNQLTKNELIQLLEESNDEETVSKNKLTTMIPLNQILYGPPGTGKTYHTINYALSIIDGEEKVAELEKAGKRKNLVDRFEELRSQGFIEFITFHQNYSYEEFIQGLRPRVESATHLTFEKKDGIFKKLADVALKNFLESSNQEVSVDPTFEEVFEDFFRPLIDETGPISVQMESKDYQFVLTKYNPENENFDFTKQSGGKGHAIYIPTLKKYFEHPEIDHTQGLKYYYRPLAKALRNRADQLRRTVSDVKREKYVLIIDEINRANISRVFGELITLIEEDKRWGNDQKMKIKLPSGDDFTVPNNFYIIGTMNTADKSIALLDIALRRRFEFIPMYPDDEYVKEEFKGFFNSLNKQIKLERGVDFAIGHSYLMENSKENKFDFLSAINKKIIPLLTEYFYSAKEGKVLELLEKAFREGGLSEAYVINNGSIGVITVQPK
ncbi:MAG TPA: AAA family ATPase [Chitinophagaceae bacterium]|nr:AAA family ATPase [Chitinophagaceae bacterium]